MGSNSSRQSEYDKQRELELEAARNFHNRLKAYNYAYHGPYYAYVESCRAQYELECIPYYCRQGAGYSSQYDAWGNRIY